MVLQSGFVIEQVCKAMIQSGLVTMQPKTPADGWRIIVDRTWFERRALGKTQSEWRAAIEHSSIRTIPGRSLTRHADLLTYRAGSVFLVKLAAQNHAAVD